MNTQQPIIYRLVYCRCGYSDKALSLPQAQKMRNDHIATHPDRDRDDTRISVEYEERETK